MNKFEEAQAHFNTLIERYGWAAHYVPLDTHYINYHTHGVKENFGHYDFQIVLPLDFDTAHRIISFFVTKVEDGVVFEENTLYEEYLQGGYKIEFKKFTEGGRELLRILLPDKNGYMPYQKECDEDYKFQLDKF